MINQTYNISHTLTPLKNGVQSTVTFVSKLDTDFRRYERSFLLAKDKPFENPWKKHGGWSL